MHYLCPMHSHRIYTYIAVLSGLLLLAVACSPDATEHTRGLPDYRPAPAEEAVPDAEPFGCDSRDIVNFTCDTILQ